MNSETFDIIGVHYLNCSFWMDVIKNFGSSFPTYLTRRVYSYKRQAAACRYCFFFFALFKKIHVIRVQVARRNYYFYLIGNRFEWE